MSSCRIKRRQIRDVVCCFWFIFGALNLASAAESTMTPEELRKAFNESLKTSAYRPKFDFKAFDFLEALVNQRQNEKWLNMFRLLDEQLDGVRNQMIPNDRGMWMTVGQWCEQLLRELPPEGLDKVRLYIDSRAKQALETIESVNDIDELYRLYDRYAVSSYGHQFADHLGDALFEIGNYHDAAIVWNRSLLHDAAEVSEVRVMAKRAVALSRMNAPVRLADTCRAMNERYGNHSINIGGSELTVSDFSKNLMSATKSSIAQSVIEGGVFQPDAPHTWKWSAYWPELEVAAKKSIPISYASNQEFAVVHLGYAAAGFDRQTAKLTWIHEWGAAPDLSPTTNSRSSRNAFRIIGNGMVLAELPMGTTPCQPAVTSDRFILRLFRENKNPKWTVRAIGAGTGKLLWTTEETFSAMQIMADPIVIGETVFIVSTPQSSNDLTLHALSVENGNQLWDMPLGSIDLMLATNRNRGIQLSKSGDRLYVFAGGEVAISVNTRQRTVNWLYQVKRETPQQGNLGRRGVWIRGMRSYQLVNVTPLSVHVDKLQVMILDPEHRELTCIDEDTQDLRWKQESIEGRIVGTDDANVYVYDSKKRNLIAIERESGKLRWETNMASPVTNNIFSVANQLYVPLGGASMRVLDRSNGEKSTIKAIPESGEIRRVIRDRDCAVTIGHERVTVFSLLPIQ